MPKIFEREPALVIGAAMAVIDAGIVLGTAFGLPLTVEQKVAIDAFGLAVFNFAAMILVRSQVIPVAVLMPRAE